MSLLELQSKPEILSDVGVVLSFQTHMHLQKIWLAITGVANILAIMSIFYDKMKMYENESNLK